MGKWSLLAFQKWKRLGDVRSQLTEVPINTSEQTRLLVSLSPYLLQDPSGWYTLPSTLNFPAPRLGWSPFPSFSSLFNPAILTKWSFWSLGLLARSWPLGS